MLSQLKRWLIPPKDPVSLAWWNQIQPLQSLPVVAFGSQNFQTELTDCFRLGQSETNWDGLRYLSLIFETEKARRNISSDPSKGQQIVKPGYNPTEERLIQISWVVYNVLYCVLYRTVLCTVVYKTINVRTSDNKDKERKRSQWDFYFVFYLKLWGHDVSFSMHVYVFKHFKGSYLKYSIRNFLLGHW